MKLATASFLLLCIIATASAHGRKKRKRGGRKKRGKRGGKKGMSEECEDEPLFEACDMIIDMGGMSQPLSTVGCGAIINTPGFYRIADDLECGDTEFGIDVQSENVFIDCMDKSITNTGS
ncbi:MAG: hypothetical protein SGARI_006201, partial [Bacillariaceae sp.]